MLNGSAHSQLAAILWPRAPLATHWADLSWLVSGRGLNTCVRRNGDVVYSGSPLNRNGPPRCFTEARSAPASLLYGRAGKLVVDAHECSDALRRRLRRRLRPRLSDRDRRSLRRSALPPPCLEYDRRSSLSGRWLPRLVFWCCPGRCLTGVAEGLCARPRLRPSRPEPRRAPAPLGRTDPSKLGLRRRDARWRPALPSSLKAARLRRGVFPRAVLPRPRPVLSSRRRVPAALLRRPARALCDRSLVLPRSRGARPLGGFPPRPPPSVPALAARLPALGRAPPRRRFATTVRASLAERSGSESLKRTVPFLTLIFFWALSMANVMKPRNNLALSGSWNHGCGGVRGRYLEPQLLGSSASAICSSMAIELV